MLDGSIRKKHIAFIFFAYIGYFLYASYFNGFGASAPVMMEFYQITSAQQGFVLTTQSVGALIVLVFFAIYGERFNKIVVYIVGVLLLGIASLFIGFTPPYFAVLILLVIIAGIGFSSADVMVNGMVPELFPKHKTTLIPLLHAFFGTGSMTTPLIITAMVNPDMPETFGRPFMLFGIAAIVSVVVLAVISRYIIPETPYANLSAKKRSASSNASEMFKTKEAWMVIGTSFLYFSFQVGLMSWLPTYCQEIGMDFGTAGTMLTYFFAGSLVMRLCSPLILTKIRVRKAYILSALIASILAAIALIISTPGAMVPLIVISGFVQGACVSLMVLIAIEAFPKMSTSATSLVFISAHAASMTAPLWTGALAEVTGFRTPLLMVCGLLALSTLLVLFLKNPPPEVSETVSANT